MLNIYQKKKNSKFIQPKPIQEYCCLVVDRRMVRIFFMYTHRETKNLDLFFISNKKKSIFLRSSCAMNIYFEFKNDNTHSSIQIMMMMIDLWQWSSSLKRCCWFVVFFIFLFLGCYRTKTRFHIIIIIQPCREREFTRNFYFLFFEIKLKNIDPNRIFQQSKKMPKNTDSSEFHHRRRRRAKIEIFHSFDLKLIFKEGRRLWIETNFFFASKYRSIAILSKVFSFLRSIQFPIIDDDRDRENKRRQN